MHQVASRLRPEGHVQLLDRDLVPIDVGPNSGPRQARLVVHHEVRRDHEALDNAPRVVKHVERVHVALAAETLTDRTETSILEHYLIELVILGYQVQLVQLQASN